jgi:hypothetical protein
MKSTITAALLFCSLFLSSAAYAQSYEAAVGARLGAPLAASFKYFFTEPGAVEVYGGFSRFGNSNGININGLYQHHFSLEQVTDNLFWYAGGGAGLWLTGRGVYLGLMGNVGLEYTFYDLPLSIGLDWTPSIFLSYSEPFAPAYGGLYARYTLR